MKHTAAHIIKETHESRELALWSENTQSIYKEIEAAALYFAKKIHKGLFDESKAFDGIIKDGLFPVFCNFYPEYR